MMSGLSLIHILIEYADDKEDTQDILKPLVLSFLLQVMRQYTAEHPEPDAARLPDRILQYMKDVYKRQAYRGADTSDLLF